MIVFDEHDFDLIRRVLEENDFETFTSTKTVQSDTQFHLIYQRRYD